MAAPDRQFTRQLRHSRYAADRAVGFGVQLLIAEPML